MTGREIFYAWYRGLPLHFTVEGNEGDLIALIDAALAAARAEEREACAVAALCALGGRAHTYASENADVYRAQDHALEKAAAAIRARKDTP